MGELKNKYISNPKVAQSEFNNIMFTIMIALLGLNKEAIENTGKIIEYKKNNNEIDISKLSKERIEGELKKALLKSNKPSIFFKNLRYNILRW